MKNRLFAILIALFITLPFMSCILAQNSPRKNLTKGEKAHLKKGSINNIKYSPDGTRLAVSNANGIWLYDARTGDELVQFTGFTDSAATIALPLHLAQTEIYLQVVAFGTMTFVCGMHIQAKTSENLQDLRIGQGALHLVRMERHS